MEQLSIDFKNSVANRLQIAIDARGYADTQFLNTIGIKKEQCNAILTGKASYINDFDWLRLSRKLDNGRPARSWQSARTDVFNNIEEDVIFCQQYAKAMICVDECGIGKTFAAKHLSAHRKNCFYVDASQGKSISLFTKNLAGALGLDTTGKYYEIKEDIKYYLKTIDNPVVIIDEAGDLSQVTLQEIKEFWNATEGYCGWYLIGADGLKYIIEKGIKNRKPGFKEVFSRFSDKYTTTVPVGREARLAFYKKLITDVLEANVADKAQVNEIVKRCLVMDGNGNISGLRRAESLLILFEKNNQTKQIENGINEKLESSTALESEALVC